MKPFILLLSAAFLSTASLSACSESNKMSIQQQTEARFKLNPEPKQAYRVRIKINDAPGPMKFYLDAVLDEDYFGEGVCRWQTYGFGLAFQATGKPEETFFNFGYDIDNGVIEKKTLTRYYQKRGYPYYKNEDGLPYGSKDSPDIDFGRDAITDYSPELRNNLFSITVTLEEVK